MKAWGIKAFLDGKLWFNIIILQDDASWLDQGTLTGLWFDQMCDYPQFPAIMNVSVPTRSYLWINLSLNIFTVNQMNIELVAPAVY